MNKKTIQLWIILLISVLCMQLKEVSARKNSEEIIVINNTGGGGCGSGAKTIVKTEGGKKKKKSGHSIILMAGGSGGKCDKHHHHTKVIHVPIPVPVPVPMKHQEQHQDHWASSSGEGNIGASEPSMGSQDWGSSGSGSSSGNSQESDHWASASSNDEIKPHLKSQKISSSSVPPHTYGHMMSRMEKQPIEQKSTLLQTLINGNEKSNSLDKKSLSNDQLTPQLITHHFMNPNQQISGELLPAPSALFSPDSIMNPAAAGMMPTIANEMQHQFAIQQHNQFHDAIQHQMRQIEHQKMHEAITSADPHQLSPDSPLVSQLPIPSPGQSLSAPVFEPINPINQTHSSQAIDLNTNNNKQQSNNIISQQFNELEIIPYEVQQQLQAAAHLKHLRHLTPQFIPDHHSLKGKSIYQSRENSLINALRNNVDNVESMNKNKKYEMINKDHAFDVSSSNAIMDATFAVLPSNLQQQHQSINHMDQILHHSSPHHLQQSSSYQEMMNMLPLHSFMMVNENKDKFNINQNDLNSQQTFPIPIIIAAPDHHQSFSQGEKMTVKRFKI